MKKEESKVKEKLLNNVSMNHEKTLQLPISLSFPLYPQLHFSPFSLPLALSRPLLWWIIQDSQLFSTVDSDGMLHQSLEQHLTTLSFLLLQIHRQEKQTASHVWKIQGRSLKTPQNHLMSTDFYISCNMTYNTKRVHRNWIWNGDRSRDMLIVYRWSAKYQEL